MHTLALCVQAIMYGEGAAQLGWIKAVLHNA
jgi:hypothetical protein